MKGAAILLILIAAVLFVIRPPGLYDSRARGDAHRRYRDNPTEANRMVLEEIKDSERREILVFSAVSISLFGTGIFLLLRTKKENAQLELVR